MFLLYNHISPKETASLQRWSDAGERVSYNCPAAVRDYFYHSRSVDVISQFHYGYLIGRKSMKCWPRLAWWLIDMCIINAFKLWSKGNDHTDQLRFREELILELGKLLPANQRPRKHGGHPLPASSLAKDHYMERSQCQRDCAVCSRQPDQRKTSSFVCHTCQTHLCIGECFAIYHRER